MNIYTNPSPEDWEEILTRPTQRFKKIEKIVKPIIKKVKKKGDKALRQFALEYDHVELDDIKVSGAEINKAEKLLSRELKEAIQTAYQNIEKFHAAQRDEPLAVQTMPGVMCMRKSVAIQKVGLYIPGGTAPLFSSVLMLGIPAKLAGCQEIVLCSPPNREGKLHPAILYAAKLIGIDRICKVGGAQAIAAMTYGTKTIPKVHKIFGPGNQYVTAAKQIVSQKGVAIDMPAGPSEVAVFADKSANPSFVAADLLSQAEHGADSQVLLVTTEKRLVERVREEISKQLSMLPRREFAIAALENSVVCIMKSSKDCIDLLNEYGAEHLILAIHDPREVMERIFNAGSVFLGHYTPESAGDYASGTNHTLPTNGYAKSYSGVSLDSFVKKITYQELTEEGLQLLGPTVEVMAEAEKLLAHKKAVSLRLAEIKHQKAV
ncbi:histidinol dehydrogenase [Catalinimonas alkaloidigena]|uniref:histidinol dehydrogenase n=1 Tax=Catalinimonas alkaloidigena TaxID=1075417 RepID=UPI0024066E08|nr:histidinol dehydrogenase [Catalinimonas alkaloidigena]MDF9795284.1 histidinol dehydrogenase [Catalinimonas alkaloidigena]